MSEVSVIGLGNMGSALARVLQENGRAVTVWNRSPEKAAPLVDMGAALAPSAAAAITIASRKQRQGNGVTHYVVAP